MKPSHLTLWLLLLGGMLALLLVGCASQPRATSTAPAIPPSSTSATASQPTSTLRLAPSPVSATAISAVTPLAALGERATVTRVIDGDTIELEGGRRVRYIGIDTPESTTQVLCFGTEATRRNAELVQGKTVQLEKDISETDRYGRLLRYVYVDGQMVNEALVREGFAQVATFPPDVKYQERFLVAQREAREANRGLWGTCLSEATATVQPPPGCAIKGNISSSGEKIYHVPGGQFYSQTVIDASKGERWFCTEEEAVANGWRKSLQ